MCLPSPLPVTVCFVLIACLISLLRYRKERLHYIGNSRFSMLVPPVVLKNLLCHFLSLITLDHRLAACSVKMWELSTSFLPNVGTPPTGKRVQQQAVYKGSALLLQVRNFHGWIASCKVLHLPHFSGEEVETMTVEGTCNQFILNCHLRTN